MQTGDVTTGRRMCFFVMTLCLLIGCSPGRNAASNARPEPVRRGTDDERAASLPSERAVAGELSRRRASRGRFYEVFSFDLRNTEGRVEIDLVSTAFDTLLFLVSPSGEVWTNDDSGEGRNSRLVVPANEVGRWIIIATSFSPGATGPFRLTGQLVTDQQRPIALTEDRDFELTPSLRRELERSPPAVASAGPDRVDEREVRYLRERIFELEERLRREAQLRTLLRSDDWDSERRFPWPPPQASAVLVVSNELFVPPGGSTLGQIDSRLSEALASCGHTEKRYYPIPDGFALVTRLEQIDAEGRPKEPRWSVEIAGLRRFSIGEYVRALFLAPAGYYRVIVFAVTSRSFAATGRPLSSDAADDLLADGSNTIPPSIQAHRFTERHRVTALIYEFEKTGHEGELNYLVPGRLTGEVHFKHSGLAGALAQRRGDADE